jgi:hypothetical protein
VTLRIFNIKREEAVAEGIARGERLDKAWSQAWASQPHTDFAARGGSLGSTLWRLVLEELQAQDPAPTILGLEQLRDPSLVLASAQEVQARLTALRQSVRPASVLELLGLAASGRWALEQHQRLTVGELAALSGLSASGVFSSARAKDPPFVYDPGCKVARIEPEAATSFLKARGVLP